MLKETIQWLNEPLTPGLTAGDLRDRIAELARLQGALDGCNNRLAVALQAAVGEQKGIEVVRESTGCSRREARRRSERAAALNDMPNTSEALSEGRITTEHADALVRAAKNTDPAAVDTDTQLLHQVSQEPADKAGQLAAEWTRQRQSAEDLEEAHRRARAKRRLDFFPGEDDMLRAVITGDNTTMAMLQARVLDMAQRLHTSQGGRDNPKHDRTWAQYRYDALFIALGIEQFPAPSRTRNGSKSQPGAGGQVLDLASDHDADNWDDGAYGDTGGRCVCGGGGKLSQRNQIVVVAQLDDLTGAGEGGPGARIPGVGPIARSELERLGCDADLQALLVDTRGEPLWLGRRRRSASPAQLKALVARDRGCVMCGASPHFCHAHHIVPWQNGGLTDIDNLVLVCLQDHNKIHDRQLRLHRQPGGRWITTHDPHMVRAHDTS